MDRIKAIIVEDEFAIAEDIRNQLEAHGFEVIASFDCAESTVPFFLTSKPDILLVDIHLLGPMNGVELVKQLQGHCRFPFVYITGNSDQSTYDAAKLTHPNAFLIKPFTPANLIAAVDLAIFNFGSNKPADGIARASGVPGQEQLVINQNLFIRNNGRYVKILADSTLFVQANGSYVNIQTIGHRYTLSQNLSSFLRTTPLSNLVRIHRSYAVNINRVDSFEDSWVVVSGHKLPLGEGYKAEFLSRINYL